MFDGVHRGHRHLLHCISGIARNVRPLVFTFRDHPMMTLCPDKAPGLLLTPDDKRARIEKEGAEVVMLDFTSELASLTASQFLKHLRDNYGVTALVLGFNNRFGSDRGLTFDDYKSIARNENIEIIAAGQLPDMPGVSSSAIRELLQKGDVKEADDMLGYGYTLTGKVGSGKHNGHRIGFPTANLIPVSDRLIIPANGVYAAVATLADGNRYDAAVNIGRRPTVDKSPDAKVSIEGHLIDFDGDIYGQPLTIEFKSRLRDERHFESIDALARQLRDDVVHCRQLSSVCPQPYEGHKR